MFDYAILVSYWPVFTKLCSLLYTVITCIIRRDSNSVFVWPCRIPVSLPLACVVTVVNATLNILLDKNFTEKSFLFGETSEHEAWIRSTEGWSWISLCRKTNKFRTLILICQPDYFK